MKYVLKERPLKIVHENSLIYLWAKNVLNDRILQWSVVILKVQESKTEKFNYKLQTTQNVWL